MKSKRLGTIKLDRAELASDLAQLQTIPMFHMYDQVTCSGHFRSCTLASNGNINANGKHTPYLTSLINNNFPLEQLLTARIFIFTANSVMMPHIDQIKDNRSFLRVHLPLQTNDLCFHSEHDTVYQMKAGELWQLNTQTPHSAACLGQQERIHLVLDLKDQAENLLLKSEPQLSLINPVPRLPCTLVDLQKLYQLADIADETNFFDIFAIVIKFHYKVQSQILQIYDWMHRIATLANKPELIELVHYWQKYCLTPRT